MPSLYFGMIVFGVLAFMASGLGLFFFRQYAITKGHFDVPNDRSSHAVPTPRGGGLVIAIVVLAAYVIASFALGYSASTGYILGSILIVAISWVDDLYSVAFHWRLMTHIVAGVALIADTGYFETLYNPISETGLFLGSLGMIVSALAIVWIVNAYNFMDGIDGIAGAQAVTASLGWLLISVHAGSSVLGVLSVAVLAATLGFLIHNWPPAKIFMGDAGSAFLGFTFAAAPFLARREGSVVGELLPWLGVLLIWLFIFDSVTTVLRRLIRGERIWEAHRSHLYQRLVINGYSHKIVTSIYLGTSLAIVFAACGTYMGFWQLYVAIFAAAICSILLVAIFLRSGRRQAP